MVHSFFATLYRSYLYKGPLPPVLDIHSLTRPSSNLTENTEILKSLFHRISAEYMELIGEFSTSGISADSLSMKKGTLIQKSGFYFDEKNGKILTTARCGGYAVHIPQLYAQGDECFFRFLTIERIKEIAKKSREENSIFAPDQAIIPLYPPKAYPPETECPNACAILSPIENSYSERETIQKIGNMDDNQQKELAKRICFIVRELGIVNASFENIRLTTDGKLAFIDPISSFFPEYRGRPTLESAEKGLENLESYFSSWENPCPYKASLAPFLQEVSKQRSESIPLSKWQLGLAVFSLGLEPLLRSVFLLLFLFWEKLRSQD